MPQNGPENQTVKVEKFSNQIDQSLDVQIQRLEGEDAEKSAVLKSLKNRILNEMKEAKATPDQGGKKTDGVKAMDDLSLSSAELKDVFESLLKDPMMKKIAEANGINTFEEFQTLIGITDLNNSKIVYIEGLDDLELNGMPVKIEGVALNTREDVGFSIAAALKKIGERKDLLKYITPDTKFVHEGGPKIKFTISKEGKEVSYSATPDDVLRIDHEATEQEKSEYRVFQAKLKLAEAKAVNILKPKGEATKGAIKDFLQTIFQFGDRLDTQNVVYQTYKNELDSILLSDAERMGDSQSKNTLFSQSEALRGKVGETRLFDEVNGLQVTESVGMALNRDYYNLEGKQVKMVAYAEGKDNPNEKHSIQHKNGMCCSVIEIDPKSNQIIKTLEYDHGGARLRRGREYANNQSLIIKEVKYDNDGVLRFKKVPSGDGFDLRTFDQNGEPLQRAVQDGNGVLTETALELGDKDEIGTINREKKSNPELSKDEYLDMLARKLDTLEKLEKFFEACFLYTYDDPKDDPTYKGPKDTPDLDVWQLPTETVDRVETGLMRGDCDDYAFLARDILQRQGKNVFVVEIPSHAICAWVEKKSDGRYDAYSLCTFGLDKNGNRYGMKQDPEKEKGYESIADAMNSLMPKYSDADGIAETSGGLSGVDKPIKYKFEKTVCLLDIPELGSKFDIRLPIEILEEPDFNKYRPDLMNLITAASNGEYVDLRAGLLRLASDPAAEKICKIFIEALPEKFKVVSQMAYEFGIRSPRISINNISYLTLNPNPDIAKIMSMRDEVLKDSPKEQMPVWLDVLVARALVESGDERGLTIWHDALIRDDALRANDTVEYLIKAEKNKVPADVIKEVLVKTMKLYPDLINHVYVKYGLMTQEQQEERKLDAVGKNMKNPNQLSDKLAGFVDYIKSFESESYKKGDWKKYNEIFLKAIFEQEPSNEAEGIRMVTQIQDTLAKAYPQLGLVVDGKIGPKALSAFVKIAELKIAESNKKPAS